MYIDSSTIGMESARRYTSSMTRTSRFVVKDYRGNSAHSTQGTFSDLLNPDMGEEALAQENATAENATEEEKVATPQSMLELRERVEAMRNGRMHLRTSTESTLDKFRQTTIRYIFSMLFGESRAKEIFGTELSDNAAGEGALSGNGQSAGNANILTISSGQYYEETETTSFSTEGIVRTADGREISINVGITMSRSFTQYFEEEFQVMQVNTCDPLVINFDGNVADLTDQKFFFDIDGDGDKDEISNLEKGSGYLALDKNGDGTINDGKELFGPNSGNGFADLAAYDDDGNGWIDEADAVWKKLKIWCRNEDGTEELYTLAEKGLGAICLQNASTDFSVKGAENRTNGIIRSTGIFLYENGNVGTVQHLDVAQ